MKYSKQNLQSSLNSTFSHLQVLPCFLCYGSQLHESIGLSTRVLETPIQSHGKVSMSFRLFNQSSLCPRLFGKVLPWASEILFAEYKHSGLQLIVRAFREHQWKTITAQSAIYGCQKLKMAMIGGLMRVHDKNVKI